MHRVLKYAFFFCWLCVSYIQADWLPPETLEGNIDSNSQSQLAIDPAGNATGLFRSATNDTIQASYKLYGGSWSVLADICSDQGINQQIVVDSNGNATAIWQSFYHIIQASTKPFGEPWQDPVDVSGAGEGRNPQIVVDSRGNATAVWGQDESIIQASTKPFGEPWQDPVNLSLAGHDATQPCIAIDKTTGDATAVWTRNNGSHYIIQASTRLSGTWQVPVDVSHDGYNAYTPQIAFDSTGNATAVWYQISGGKKVIQASTKLIDQLWQDPVNLSDEGYNAYPPQIAIDYAGNATALWSLHKGSNNIIQASTKLFGGTWPQTPSDLASVRQDSGIPQIAFDDLGNATALWDADDGTNWTAQSSNRFSSPAVTSVSPNTGPMSGGASVTITGSVFINVTAINFGSVPATSFTVVSPTEIIAIAPMGSPGIVDIQVQAAGGSSPITDADQYQYCAAPTVTSVMPTGGPTAGGTSVTITGTTFVGVTAVNFGSVPATSFTVVSPTEIIAIAPAGSPGTVYIQVKAAGGFSPITDTNRYQYQPSAPRHFRGTVEERHHSHEHKYVLRTHWKASPSTDTSAYRLYKRKKIIATIPSNSKRTFKAHLIWKQSWKKFSITAVTANNAESVHKKLKIKH